MLTPRGMGLCAPNRGEGGALATAAASAAPPRPLVTAVATRVNKVTSCTQARLEGRTKPGGQKTCNIGLYVTAPNCPQKSQLPQNTKCLTPISILRVVVALVGRGLEGGHLYL